MGGGLVLLRFFATAPWRRRWLSAEGGYDLGALGDSVAEACRGLVGLPSDPTEDTDALYDPPSKRIEEAIEAASERARDFL